MRLLSTVMLALLISGCANLQPKNQIIDLQRQADNAYSQGDFATSTKLYGQLAKKMPTDAGVRYQLGNSQARQGDNQAAIASYRDALVRDPQHARSWHNLLQVQLREASVTASEMRRYLNDQTPYADKALQRADKLLEVFPQAEE
ncbi:tetratricopeptide repeat protein [Ectopseudomonas mendocina]|uniref:Tetratricopeptide repeat protein n=1 Tax=Ectopseudomonas mendocina TaxID=300 RepID=A0ABZ2REY1_ECTME